MKETLKKYRIATNGEVYRIEIFTVYNNQWTFAFPRFSSKDYYSDLGEAQADIVELEKNFKRQDDTWAPIE